MNLNIRTTWAAWSWVNSTALLIGDIFAELWYSFITDLEYESKIKGGTNFFDVNISNNNSQFLTNKVDIVLAFDYKSLEKQIQSLKKNSTIIISKKELEKIEKDSELNNIIFEENNFNILDLEITDKYVNTYLLWILCKYLNIDSDIVIQKIEHVFEWKSIEIIENNQNIVNEIYNSYNIQNKSEIEITRIWKVKKITFWNKAISYWSIEWWLDFFSAYPMTPASTVLTEIINSKKVQYIQNEDEIAVINSALWASFTWARAMCATSGWWFALMSEALSFAVQAEFPITVVLSQRAGPSTWTPTYHEAWDLNFALNPTFWDFDHLVIYPSNLEEAYYFWWLALNIADKYQTQVILLTDKQSSELHWTVSKQEVPKIDRWIILDNPPVDYKRYELNFSWISPRVEVWTKNWDFISTSYEHDEYGATTEDPEMKKLMTEKRFKKLENFFKKQWISWYEIINPEAKKIIITSWFIAYTAKEFVKNNPDFGLIIMKIIKPLDERILDEIKDKQEVIFVESNYSWQLENYITKELWLKFIDWLKISHIRKYDLFPFYIEDFNELI